MATQYIHHDAAVESLIELFDDGGLSRGEAEAYVYRDVLERSPDDAAAALGKTTSTVETLLSRGRRKLDAVDEARERADGLRSGSVERD